MPKSHRLKRSSIASFVVFILLLGSVGSFLKGFIKDYDASGVQEVQTLTASALGFNRGLYCDYSSGGWDCGLLDVRLLKTVMKKEAFGEPLTAHFELVRRSDWGFVEYIAAYFGVFAEWGVCIVFLLIVGKLSEPLEEKLEEEVIYIS